MNESYTRLKIERDGAVTSVVLNRPEVHDAFDDVTIAELTDVFTALADDADTRVVLLRSTGKHFSAGADLNWMRRMADYSQEESRADAQRLERMFRAIATCPRPVVARVQGAALGGGSGLVATADIAVASHPAVGSPSRGPTARRIKKPTRGKAGMSQTSSSTAIYPLSAERSSAVEPG